MNQSLYDELLSAAADKIVLQKPKPEPVGIEWQVTGEVSLNREGGFTNGGRYCFFKVFVQEPGVEIVRGVIHEEPYVWIGLHDFRTESGVADKRRDGDLAAACLKMGIDYYASEIRVLGFGDSLGLMYLDSVESRVQDNKWYDQWIKRVNKTDNDVILTGPLRCLAETSLIYKSLLKEAVS